MSACNYTALSILSAGTYASQTFGSAVNITDFTGAVLLVENCGPSLAGAAPTCDVKIETSGTVGGPWIGVEASGTFPTANFAGTFACLNLSSEGYNNYIRAVVTPSGSAKFPVSVEAIGLKQNSP